MLFKDISDYSIMKPYTVYLEKEDIDLLQETARRMRVPPHVLARSLLLRMLERERSNIDLRG
jgi:hypothetical protein